MNSFFPAVLFLRKLFISFSNSGKNKIYKELDQSLIQSKSDNVLTNIVNPGKDSTKLFPPVRVDENGGILLMPSSNPDVSYDKIIYSIWKFWNNMKTNTRRVKYYLLHQFWKKYLDPRGMAGNQLMIALSS
ncbi:MAG: hypothetical protein JST21_06795 [Bacteroidetes bacterium]|nr:hypothetical protein [Bacteroidota bacterium]